MAIQYVTGKQNTTFVPANKQGLADNIETVLLAAGWTTVSGSGTTNLLMQSDTTPQGYAIRVRMKDNAGTCLTFSLESTDGVLVGGNSTTAGGAFINPGASSITFRIVASKYQAFIWASPSTTARSFASFGVPYVPSFATGMTRVGWMHGNAATDADTVVRASFRTALSGVVISGSTGYPATQVMTNATLWSMNTTAAISQVGAVNLACYASSYVNGTTMAMVTYLWQDASALLIDPLIAWAETGATGAARFKGQLWDAVVVTDAYTGDLTSTFDSHNWIVLTDNNTGGALGLRGSLLLAVT